MIPLRIEITNLGAIPYANIDLSNVTLAAICGKNGAGKSTAFTIAPLFALFGTTKNGCSVDDLVRTGSQEMSVTFEFEHRGEVYCVTRTRSTKGKGKSTLELQQRIGDGWESLSGTTIRETEEKIKDLLSLDADIFTASSMILQGKANEFTSKSPGQRKAVLAQVLGLEIYDKLQEAARVKERAEAIELGKAKAKLAELEERISGKQSILLEINLVNDELLRSQTLFRVKQKELIEEEEKFKQLQIQKAKAEDITERIGTLNDSIAALETERISLQSKLERAQKMLAAEPQIIEKAAELEQVKKKIAILEVKELRLAEITAEGNRLKNEITGLNSNIDKLNRQIQEIEAILAIQEQLMQVAEQYQKAVDELANMDQLALKWASVDRQVREAKFAFDQEALKIEMRKETLQKEIAILSQKTAMLQDSNCLDATKASCKFLFDAQEAKRKLVEVQEQYNNLDTKEVDRLYSLSITLQEQRDKIGYNEQEHNRLKCLVTELRPKAEMAAQLNGKKELLNSLQTQKQQLAEQRNRQTDHLNTILKEYDAVAQEVKALPELIARLPKLEGWVKAKEELPVAREIIVSSNERLSVINSDLDEKKELVQDLTQERTAFLIDVADISSIKSSIESCRSSITFLQDEQNQLHAQLGRLNAMLTSIEKDEEEHRQLAAEIETLAKQLIMWQTLVKAFGRDGIPALIIENAVPELERISNEILGQMSNGKHSLKLETRRDLKSKAGVAETLDIIVEDWAGERPYETFSGGEQLRIDFAIRFALAELLARRAGAKIEWLTVDEGLGSQDAEHRALVLESIKAVSDRFRKTLVITHIEEAQAVFEQRILFEPGDGEVYIKVA